MHAWLPDSLHNRQVGFEEPLTEETFKDGELLMREGRPGADCVCQGMAPRRILSLKCLGSYYKALCRNDSCVAARYTAKCRIVSELAFRCSSAAVTKSQTAVLLSLDPCNVSCCLRHCHRVPHASIGQ